MTEGQLQFLTTLGGVLVVLVALLELGAYLGKTPSVISGLYSVTPWGRRREAYKRLNQLAIGVQVDYITQLQGQPVFKNPIDSSWEYIYVERDCYVQVLTDNVGAVTMFCVTATNGRFNPPTWITRARWSPRPQLPTSRLGTFFFGDVPISGDDPIPWGITGWVGARRFGYAECYYYGNPANYQIYILGLNDGGWYEIESVRGMASLFLSPIALGVCAHRDIKEDDERIIRDFLARPDVREWRSRARPNTYGETAPYHDLDRLPNVRFGPDADQVRLLPQGPTRR